MRDAATYAGATQEPYITELKTPIPGYAVRIPHKDGSGKITRRNFKGASRPLAEQLVLARAWRDATYRKLFGEAVPQRVFHRRQENSVTGFPGVRLTTRR